MVSLAEEKMCLKEESRPTPSSARPQHPCEVFGISLYEVPTTLRSFLSWIDLITPEEKTEKVSHREQKNMPLLWRWEAQQFTREEIPKTCGRDLETADT